MGLTSIVVANEPLSYREVLAGAFRRLRPDLRVVTVEPDELDDHLACGEALLVVHSRASEAVGTRTAAWILLNPGGANWAMISVAGRQTVLTDVQFGDLLEVLEGLAGLRAATTAFAVQEGA